MAFSETKGLFSSLTVNASVVALAASALNAFGINLAPDVIPNAQSIVAGVAAAIAIWGRIRAKTLIQ